MRKYKIYHQQPDNPLPVTQEMCERSSKGLKAKMKNFQRYILPEGNMMSDVELFRLDYLNTALEILKDCNGFQEHIAEYKNNPKSTFFVTVVADILAGHGLIVELEPQIIGQEKRPDLLAHQPPNGLGIYFECKQPKEDTEKYYPEQEKIFEGIKDVISDQYCLALFYKKELKTDDIVTFHDLIEASFNELPDVYENRCIVENDNLGVKLVISGVPEDIEKKSCVRVTGIPNFSDHKGYSNANGINKYGKNILFYKACSFNTVDSLLKDTRGKVPESSPYVVCFDISGPRFDPDRLEQHVTGHFEKRDNTSISGVLLVVHGVTEDGRYGVELRYIENINAKYDLPFLNKFFSQTFAVDVEARYQTK